MDRLISPGVRAVSVVISLAVTIVLAAPIISLAARIIV
jgi:hypothetical protein